MKTIRVKVYSFDELNKQAKVKAICDHINFEIEIMQDESSPFWEAAEEMERMQTPWFLAEKIYHTRDLRDIIIETIKINEYQFKQDGTMF